MRAPICVDAARRDEARREGTRDEWTGREGKGTEYAKKESRMEREEKRSGEQRRMMKSGNEARGVETQRAAGPSGRKLMLESREQDERTHGRSKERTRSRRLVKDERTRSREIAERGSISWCIGQRQSWRNAAISVTSAKRTCPMLHDPTKTGLGQPEWQRRH